MKSKYYYCDICGGGFLPLQSTYFCPFCGGNHVHGYKEEFIDSFSIPNWVIEIWENE